MGIMRNTGFMTVLICLAMIMTGCSSEQGPPSVLSGQSIEQPSTEATKTPTPEVKQDSLQLEGYDQMAISPPHAYKNLTLFFISLPKQVKGDEFLLLTEAMEKKLVTVTEKEQAQVSELLIENLSSRPVFIQVGDIVKGGKQTRTIQASLVIPPKSGRIKLPSLCVEQSRWSGSKSFDYSCASNVGSFGGKEMRKALQGKSQGKVWEEVAEFKEKARNVLVFGETVAKASQTSSVTEELENREMDEAAQEFEKALDKLLDQYPKAVGLAYAVNGEIATVELYQGHALLKIMYPRLIKSFAIEAITNPAKEKEPKQVTAEAVKDFMARSLDGQKQAEELESSRITRIENDEALSSQSEYEGKKIHTQIINK